MGPWTRHRFEPAGPAGRCLICGRRAEREDDAWHERPKREPAASAEAAGFVTIWLHTRHGDQPLLLRVTWLH